MELRPYQKEAVRAINEKWDEWQRELLVLPTGCGKTIVFNTIANQRPGRTLILAHREELIEQARDKYNGMFGEMPGKIKAQENDIRRVTVGSIQARLCRRVRYGNHRRGTSCGKPIVSEVTGSAPGCEGARRYCDA